MDHWAHEAQQGTGGRILGYRSERDGTTVGLLHAPELGRRDPFMCLNSLREVEPAIGLILDDRGFDTEPPVAAGALAGPAPEGGEAS